METFVSRVNASLPTREPDVFLLSLVQGQSGDVCGQTCTTGQVSRDGRCVAKAIIADAGDSPPSAAPELTAAARPAPLPGRMSIGGPVPDAEATAPVTGWPAPAGERLPWQTQTPGTAPAQDPAQDLAVLSPEQAPGDDLGSVGPAPRKVSRTKKSWNPPKQKQPRRTYSSARSVQLMFMHPLGRM
jgi:hypothetical protein